ncbi:hypothetical protein [Pseudorhodoferax sp. Leaf267]|uniref:hypothetical protein n=1 Tax=Pseudorhodoferax sp. Leaf267 TaxID=1736316 RepID=UPI0012E1821D|nr:hypothetical protein [Pseudorhodoferax sp. Leaf267]
MHELQGTAWSRFLAALPSTTRASNAINSTAFISISSDNAHRPPLALCDAAMCSRQGHSTRLLHPVRILGPQPPLLIGLIEKVLVEHIDHIPIRHHAASIQKLLTHDGR